MNNSLIEAQIARYRPPKGINVRELATNIKSVNYHLTKACNYSCQFCFAKFSQVNHSLPSEDAKALIEQLTCSGMQKITFVGGEPFLYPDLGKLIAHSKDLSLTTMVVTNGSRITQSFLDNYANCLDWMGLSIDSGSDSTERKLGRLDKSRGTQEFRHVENIRMVVPVVRDLGIKIKINTVVTALNWYENMNWLIDELSPHRWKVLQVSKIIGENDCTVDPLLITSEQFQFFINRHRRYNPVFESCEAMKGSYVMIDPLGRFFDNSYGWHCYSRPVLEVGVMKAFTDIHFSLEKFLKRGGLYDWE